MRQHFADTVPHHKVKTFDELAALLAPRLAPGLCGLSGGSTFPPLMKALASRRRELAAGLVWTWIDERLVPAKDPGNNFGAVVDALAGDTMIPLPFSDDDAAASAYMHACAGTGLPQLQNLLLGFGDDGHVASLFPGQPQLDKDSKPGAWIVRATASYEPKERWSWTLGSLAAAKHLFVIFKGSDDSAKAEHVRQALNGHGDTPLTRLFLRSSGRLEIFQVEG